MRIQWVRNVTGKIIGVAITRKGIVLEDANHKLREFAQRPLRICDMCCANPAELFCFGHQQYVCAACVNFHTELGRCRYVSVSGHGKHAQRSLTAVPI